MRYFIISAAFFIVCTDCLISQTEEAIALNTSVGEVNGTLLVVDQKAPSPLAIIVAGSGPTDRDGNNPYMINNSLKMLAVGLVEHGISSLRYDKRGVAGSSAVQQGESDLRFDHYIDDVVSWVSLLSRDDRFNGITIVGHSEGALLGMVAAQDNNVTKYVSLAGIGGTVGQTLRKQFGDQSPMLLEQSLPIIEALEKGDTISEVPAMLHTLFRPSVQPYIISWMKYHPQKEIAKLEKPVLIIQGTTDIQVGEDNATLLQSANTDASLNIFEGMNHIMKAAPMDRMSNLLTYSQPDLPLVDGLIDSLARFILMDH